MKGKLLYRILRKKNKPKGENEFNAIISDDQSRETIVARLEEVLELGDEVEIISDANFDQAAYDLDCERFHREPSIRKYLELRKRYPTENPNTNPLTDIDLPPLMEREYQEYGFDLLSICGALDGGQSEQELLSIKLLEEIQKAKDLKARGESAIHVRKLAMPAAKIDFLIVLMLKGMAFSGQSEISHAFNFLLRVKLGELESTLTQLSRTTALMDFATKIGGYMLDIGIQPSFRNVAKIMGVQPSTISRWFTIEKFKEKCEFQLKIHFESLFPQSDEERKERAEWVRADPLHQFIRAQHHK